MVIDGKEEPSFTDVGQPVLQPRLEDHCLPGRDGGKNLLVVNGVKGEALMPSRN
jgi:hypothetical protein